MIKIHSIKTKVILSLLAIMGGAFLFLTLVIEPRIEEGNIRDAGRAQQTLAGQLAGNLDAAFRSAQLELESMADLPAVRSLDPDGLNHTIRIFNASNRFFNYYFVMDPEGRWLSYPTRPELVGKRIPRSNMGWVRRTLEEDRTVFLDVVKSRIGTLVSGFSTPIRGEDGKPRALLRGVIVVSEENALLRILRDVRVGDNGFAFLISSNGWLLAHPHISPEIEGFERFRYAGHEPAKAALRGEGGIMRSDHEGTSRMVAFRPVPTTGWAVLVQQPFEDIVAGARQEARTISLVFLTMFSLTLLVATVVIQLALRPLTRLIREIRTGDIGAASRVYPQDEIGHLARRFDEVYTDLYRSRERLARSESKFRTLFDSTNDAIFIHDLQGRVLEVNRVACERLGFEREEMRRLGLQNLDAPSSAPMVQDRIRKIQETGHGLFEAEHVTRDGRTVPVEINARLIEFEGQPAVLSVARNLTERKEAQRALLESEEKYRLLVEKQQDLVVKVDQEGRFLFVSPSYCELFGQTAEDLLGQPFMPLVHEEDRAATERAMETLHQPPYTAYMEQRAMTRYGWRWLAWVDTAILDEDGAVSAVHGLGRDITPQKEAEQALRQEKERFQALVEQSPFALVLADTSHRIEYLNPRFIEIFGYTREDIPTVRDWFERAYPDPDYRKEVIATWEADKRSADPGRAAHRTFMVRCKNGSDKEVHFRLVLLETGEQLTFLEDVTERKRLEAQFQQAQKMEALGTLAGGIAHDFNNLLMGIQGRASLLLSDPDLVPAGRDHLRGIESHIQSATELTRQLLGVARGGKYEVRSTDLNQLVRRSAEMFGRTKKEIRLHFKLQDDLHGVEVDQGQIEQVLLNLYVNAWQAMPAGGELYLETGGETLDAAEAEPHGIPPGRFSKISVADTGVGMDEDIQARIFDPFFTTKEMGRGTGLGLASAYGIVKNHGGFISVASEKGHGATFTVYLPAGGEPSRETPTEAESVVRGSGRVLLVDDEDMVLEVGGQMLENLGYDVVSAASGEEAVRIVRDTGDRIDLVVLDMIMPGMGGGETFDRMQEIAPGIRVLLSSGYSINGEATEILRRGCRGFIQKPFNLADLSRKVAESMDRRPS